jgi:hypothetical protein
MVLVAVSVQVRGDLEFYWVFDCGIFGWCRWVDHAFVTFSWQVIPVTSIMLCRGIFYFFFLFRLIFGFFNRFRGRWYFLNNSLSFVNGLIFDQRSRVGGWRILLIFEDHGCGVYVELLRRIFWSGLGYSHLWLLNLFQPIHFNWVSSSPTILFLRLLSHTFLCLQIFSWISRILDLWSCFWDIISSLNPCLIGQIF